MSDPYEPVTPTYRSPDTPTWTDQPDSTARTAYTPPTTGDGARAGDSGSSGTADVAKEQAANVKDTTVDAGKLVAGTAKDEAKNVASEVKTQAKDLIGRSRSQLTEQAATQQKRAASGIRSLGSELSDMADKSDNSGPATDLVKNVASRADGVASWLDDRDPRSVLNEVTDFARRRPGTFIAIAAVAGVVVGRLTRSIVSETKDAKEASTPSDSNSASFSSNANHVADAPISSNADYAGAAGTGYVAPATTDNFDSAGDYLGSGSSNPDPLEQPLIDEPPLSTGNEPYRSPLDDPYRSGDTR